MMDGEGRFSISARNLYSRLGTEQAPIIIDVRRSPGFDADDTIIVGAIRRLPAEVDHWQRELPRGRPVVVYCAHSQEVSQNAAETQRISGIEASYLEHGISGWTELGLPRRRKLSAPSGKWVTRERPKIDRIACPWLIRCFIDPEALFLFAPTERVFVIAAETGATAYDIPGAEPFSHDGELCSFDAFLKVYAIADPALDALALIVRGTDTARAEVDPFTISFDGRQLFTAQDIPLPDREKWDFGRKPTA